jgi:hypothetical protein
VCSDVGSFYDHRAHGSQSITRWKETPTEDIAGNRKEIIAGASYLVISPSGGL